jgi:hypothetical protein
VKGPIDPKRSVPLVDLGTVRDTLAYIRDDFQRVPGLERAAELIDSACRDPVGRAPRDSAYPPLLVKPGAGAQVSCRPIFAQV